MGGVNRVHHAFKITLSPGDHSVKDFPDAFDQLLAFCKQDLIQWYCIKHELGESGTHLHIHALIIVRQATERTKGRCGAKTTGNFKASLLLHCSIMREMVACNNKRCLMVTPLYDTLWITQYMHKESEMTTCNLPDDLEAMVPFLSTDPGKPKDADAKMAKYAALARADGLSDTSTFAEVCIWLRKAANVDRTIPTSRDDATEVHLAKKLHSYLTKSVELTDAMKKELAKRQAPPPTKFMPSIKPTTSEGFLDMWNQNMM